MSTRFYPARTAAAAVSPAYNAAWGDTANAIRRKLTLDKPNETQADISTTTSVTSGTNKNVLMVQYVSDPLKAQSLSGTLEALLAVRESNAGLNAEAHIVAYVVSNDGATVRGVLYTSANNASATGANEWTSGTYPTTKRFPNAGAASFTTLGVLDGDRLVVEVGARVYPTVTGSHSLVINHRTDATADFPKANNYPAYDGTSPRNGMGWIECSDDVLVQADPARVYSLEFTGTISGSVAADGITPWAATGTWLSATGALSNCFTQAATTDASNPALSANVTSSMKAVEFLIELPRTFEDNSIATLYSFPGGSISILDNGDGTGALYMPGLGSFVFQTSELLGAGKKIHLLLTIDSGNTLRVYVNGALFRTQSCPISSFPAGTHYVNGQPGAGYQWSGNGIKYQIVSGYSDSVSAAQALALFNKHARTDVVPLPWHLFKFQDTGATQSDSVWGSTVTPTAGWATDYIPQSGKFTRSVKANTGTPKMTIPTTDVIKSIEIMVRTPRTPAHVDLLAWGAGSNQKIWVETSYGYFVAADVATGHGKTYSEVMHLIVVFEAANVISLYSDGVRVGQAINNFATTPASIAAAVNTYLNGYAATGGAYNTTDVAYQVLGMYRQALTPDQAAALYADRNPTSPTIPTKTYALNFYEAASPFNDLMGGTDWATSGSWSFQDAPVHAGFTNAARTNDAAAYASQTTPAGVRAYEFYIVPPSSPVSLVAWGANQTDEVRIVGSNIIASGAQATSGKIFAGKAVHVIVSLDGGDDVSIFVNGKRETSANYAAVIASVGAGTTYLNGSPSNALVFRAAGLKWQYFAAYSSPIADDVADAIYQSRLIGSGTNFVAIGASVLPTGAVRVSLASTQAKIKVVRTDGVSPTPTVLIEDRTFTGNYEVIDTTAPYGTSLTYTVTAVYTSDLSAGSDTVTLTNVPFPDGEEFGVCYPVILGDPVLEAGNVIATLQSLNEAQYQARSAAYTVIGKNETVAISSKRSAPVSGAVFITKSNSEAAAIRALLASGRVLMFRVPPEARPEKPYWYADVQGATESRILTDIRRPERKWTLEFAEVERPDISALLPADNTWAGVLANNTSWTSLAARAGSWDTVVNDPTIGGEPA